MFFAITHNLKNVNNDHGRVLPLVKLQASACNFNKSNTFMCVFHVFLNNKNGTKASHMLIKPF